MESDHVPRSRLGYACIDFASGCLGGTSAILVGQPLDTVKVKLQTSPSEVYRGSMVKCFRTTLANEGLVKGLYAGTMPSILANVGEISVLFMCYTQCQTAVARLTADRDIKRLR
jgi:solute carrier family 25 ornithine transporter 2/15